MDFIELLIWIPMTCFLVYLALAAYRAYVAARRATDHVGRRRASREFMRNELRAHGLLFVTAGGVMSLVAASPLFLVVMTTAGLGVIALTRFMNRDPLAFVITGVGPGEPLLPWAFILGTGPDDLAEEAR